MSYILSMCIMLTILDASIENQKVYGNICIEIFPRQKSHRIKFDSFFVIWGYHDQHSIPQKVYKIEIYFLQFRKAK